MDIARIVCAIKIINNKYDSKSIPVPVKDAPKKSN